MKDKKKLTETVLLLLIVILGISLIWKFVRLNFNYERFHTDGITYEKAIVTAVVKEELELYEADDEHMVGYQLLRVRFLEGNEKGKELEIENYISITHNVILKNGDRLVVCADRPVGAEPYYTVYNYDRSTGIWTLAAGFLFLIVLIGRRQGVRSCLGLIFTMIMVVCYLLPSLYTGKSAVFSAVLTVGVSSIVTCFCIGGLEKKTFYNMLSSTLGGISAGIMVAALGAVMDVAVSLGAALNEIQMLNSKISGKELFRSGINIGRDMIGTMTNTLILAFAGGSLSTLIVFISYGVQYNQLLSSNFFAVEVVQGIAGSSAVILTVPITAAVCALGYRRRK